MWAVSYMWYLVVPSGLSGKHLEGGASHSLHGRPSCLGENAGEDEVCRSQVFNSAQEGGCLGQRCRSADQSDQDESVCTCYEITAFISVISGSCFHMLWFSLLTVIIFSLGTSLLHQIVGILSMHHVYPGSQRDSQLVHHIVCLICYLLDTGFMCACLYTTRLRV